jgi:glycosyltransferase involved in cell wall biosynthesis
MCLAIPPIVTRAGGLPELVEDGTSGLVVPPRDSQELQLAIRKLASDRDLRQAIGRAALERVRASFSFEGTLEKILALYASVSDAFVRTK